MTDVPSFDLYRRLFLVRRAEEYIIKHYQEDLMRTPMHMSMGQEFVSVGVCMALNGRGDIFASYRSHAAFLAQTADTDRFFGELYGRTNGIADGKGGSMHLAAPECGHILSSGVVASAIPAAVGAGYANERFNNDRTAAVFFGDGALDAGVFWECINTASLFRLPILFVCEDNGFAVHTPRTERHAFNNVCDVVRKFKCAVYEDVSNDVESVYRLTLEATANARADRRPAFLNIKCYRYLEHVGINEDWMIGYRNKSELEFWLSRDSLKIQRERLLSSGLTEVQVVESESEIDRAIQLSVRNAAVAPAPTSELLYEGVFYAAH